MRNIENPCAPVNEATKAEVHRAALEAHAAGLCIVPPAQDGTKRPLPDQSGKWDQFKWQRPSDELFGSWYPGRTGLGIVTGPVSGGVECWDFDDFPTYLNFKSAANACGLGEVVARIENGYCDTTPGEGVRWLVRYPHQVERRPGDRLVLAKRPKREEERRHDKDRIKVLIEMPGYSIVAPSNGCVHPTGKPYARKKGGFSSIANYTAEERQELLRLGRSFDETRVPERPPTIAPAVAAGARPELGERPGDAFNAATTWETLLTPRGWTPLVSRGDETYWRRPGKAFGVSATTNYRGSDLLYVFTTSSEFEADKAYDRFAAYAVLEHGGDFGAAAKALATKGYGRASTKPLPTGASAACQVLHEVGDYRETGTGIEYLHRTNKADIWSGLTNFTARIVSDLVQDDGIETIRALEIEAHLNNRTHRFTVPAAQFGHMNWVLEHLGAEAVVQPGQGSKDRTRAAIQILSGSIRQRRVYTHTGFRNVDGQSVYMHAGGALGPVGPVDGIEVQLSEQLDRYYLPEVADLKSDVMASLALRNVAPNTVTDPLIAAIYRAPIGGADFSIHISGFTGTRKSELAALAQQHFGPDMDARALPASWSSTANALEIMASAVKDAVMVIDDYVPQGTVADRARLNAQADRVLRAQGNHSGRGRLRADTTMRRARPPRGLIISTGEEVPGGQSLRARLVVVEVQRTDVRLDQLTIAQQHARDGAYARAMAGFIMWLAPQLESIQRELTKIAHARRLEIAVAHGRTADAIAQLCASVSIFLRFAVDAKAISTTEAAVLESEMWASLAALAGEQQTLQADSDPVDRFTSLLSSALSSGRAHIASAANPDRRPENHIVAKALGWRTHGDAAVWVAQGSCVGWWADDGVYLDPEASYAVAQQLGSASGEGVGVASATLWRRMHERGLLLSTERAGGETRLRCRKVIGGNRKRVVHIARAPLVTETGPSGPIGPHHQKHKSNQVDAGHEWWPGDDGVARNTGPDGPVPGTADHWS
jgi:hypothetical protein